MPVAKRQRTGVLAMNNLSETQQRAIDLIMQLDAIDTEIFIEGMKSGYFKQDHTEAEARAYIEKARQQYKK